MPSRARSLRRVEVSHTWSHEKYSVYTSHSSLEIAKLDDSTQRACRSDYDSLRKSTEKNDQEIHDQELNVKKMLQESCSKMPPDCRRRLSESPASWTESALQLVIMHTIPYNS